MLHPPLRVEALGKDHGRGGRKGARKGGKEGENGSGSVGEEGKRRGGCLGEEEGGVVPRRDAYRINEAS